MLIILCCVGCPVHYKIFSSSLGFYPLEYNSTLSSVVTNKNVSRHYQMFSRGQNCLRTTALDPLLGTATLPRPASGEAVLIVNTFFFSSLNYCL